MNSLYEEYGVIEAKIKELTGKKDQLKIQIIGQMVEKGEDKVSTPFGSFTKVNLKSWEYPEYVTKLGDDFKAAKAKAESTGEATYTETNSLRFVAVKL